MYQISDSDSADSDRGIRYKTDSIRNKSKNSETGSKRDSSRDNRSPRRERKSLHKDKHREKRKTHSSHRDRDRDRRKHQEKDKLERDCKRTNEDGSPVTDVQSLQQSPASVQTQKHPNEVKYMGPALPPHLQKKLGENSQKMIENKDSYSFTQNVLDSPSEETKKSVISLIHSEPSNASDDHSDLPTQESRLAVDCMKDDLYGPTLPAAKPSGNTDNDTKSGNKIIGPMLPNSPTHMENEAIEQNSIESNKEIKVIGPALPPHLQKNLENQELLCGPSLPTMQEQNPEKYIGPALPSHLREKLSQDSECQEKDEEEEEVYGPVPMGASFSRSHVELEERALEMKIAQLDPQQLKQPGREEWMLELPAVKAVNLGLGPRQFRTKAGPDFSDRSTWTDTPKDKERKKQGKEEPKVNLQREMELMEMKKRDKEQEALAKKSKRNKESLVDMHKKKLKSTKDDTAPLERRPFSRETDLQVNRFDEAQKKAVMKKAQLLDNRFSSGESKFL
nr:GPALPP motifs-containing protein 1 [Leptinotarsa decemlineata]XP_023029767.1 GPALPP motifs-containing protein 1 [Leptinotarsa decemlineata]XP_023029768.1 GPALPP motifs-containing protein 1 [Leptinotarsa decemlineata]